MSAPLFIREFGAKTGVPEAIAQHPKLQDVSWHNDVCPSFAIKGDPEYLIRLWVEMENPAEREDPDALRYRVIDQDAPTVVFESETDFQGAIAALLAAHAQPNVLDVLQRSLAVIETSEGSEEHTDLRLELAVLIARAK